MIQYTTASDADLSGILELQKANLRPTLTPEEEKSQGFLTVSHTFEQIKSLNDIERHIVAKDRDEVAAYLLAMTVMSRDALPLLVPMFDFFGKARYRGKLISDFNYIVVGQACVGKKYRGQGLFDQCYSAYRDHFKHKYDFAITEIAALNKRSQAAHYRVGFREIDRYVAPDGIEWCIVVWDWQNKA